jgi:hypothetical protein
MITSGPRPGTSSVYTAELGVVTSLHEFNDNGRWQFNFGDTGLVLGSKAFIDKDLYFKFRDILIKAYHHARYELQKF